MVPIIWRRLLITITAVAAVVASFFFLTDLAIHAGWPTHVAWLLPLCIDALAGMSLTQYRMTGDRGAGVVAVLAVVFSAAGNAASHWYSTGLLVPGWPIVTLVGAVPAVALGLCIHLVTKGTAWTTQRNPAHTTDQHHQNLPDTPAADGSGSSSSASGSGTDRNHPGPVPKPPPTTPAPAAASPPGSKPTTSTKRRTDIELLDLIRSNGWETETLNGLVAKLSVSKSRASRLRHLLTSYSTPVTLNGQPSSADVLGVEDAA